MQRTKQEIIGIVVPVYNVESYLARCLDSILSQSFKHFVIVLVNDASTDSSREICLKYQLREKSIIFIDADSNAGQACVRNKALKILEQAHTPIQSLISQDTIYTHYTHIPQVTYIMFVDSDDFLQPYALEHIISRFKAYNDVDMCIYNRHYVVNARGEVGLGGYAIFKHIPNDRIYTPLEILQLNPKNLITTAWAFVYQASFLFREHLKFIEGILYEDVPFCTQSFLQAHKVYVDSTPLYNYYLSPTSTMRGTMDSKKIQKSFESWLVIIDFFITQCAQETTHYKRVFYKTTLQICIKRVFELLCVNGYCNGISRERLKPYLPYIKGKYRLFYYFPRLKKFL